MGVEKLELLLRAILSLLQADDLAAMEAWLAGRSIDVMPTDLAEARKTRVHNANVSDVLLLVREHMNR